MGVPRPLLLLLLLPEPRIPLEASTPAPQALYGRRHPISPRRPPSSPQPGPSQPPGGRARTCPSPGPTMTQMTHPAGGREGGQEGGRAARAVGAGGGRGEGEDQTVSGHSRSRQPAEQSFPSRAWRRALPGLLAPPGGPDRPTPLRSRWALPEAQAPSLGTQGTDTPDPGSRPRPSQQRQPLPRGSRL